MKNIASDYITNDYCHRILEGLASHPDNAVVGAKSLFIEQKVPFDEIDVVVRLLKKHDFVSVTKNPDQNRDLHLTWKGRYYVKTVQREREQMPFMPPSLVGGKTEDKPFPWGNFWAIVSIVVSIIIAWTQCRK